MTGSLDRRQKSGIARFVAIVLATMTATSTSMADDLGPALAEVLPQVRKWATVVEVSGPADAPVFTWHHYRDSAESVAFWPASTIKIYTVIAALEYLNELDMPLDSVLIFERKTDDKWVLDCSRTMREMCSEVFRRSSNEDYTLLLRFVGIDRINTRFLIPQRGFGHSALMRGYVRGRPYSYQRDEAQRITVRAADGKTKTIEHAWSGKSYSKERGATVISATTGNCTSTAELAECMRRIMFHEHIDKDDRYRLTDEQIAFVREGGDGLFGLRQNEAGAYTYQGAKDLLPDAMYYHKGGLISTHCLDIAYVDDPKSGRRFIVSFAAETGDEKKAPLIAAALVKWVLEKEPADDR